MANIDLLVRRGAVIKGKLTIFSEFVMKLASPITDENLLLELEQRSERCASLLNDFEAVQLDIELLSTEVESRILGRKTFEHIFYAFTTKTKNVLNFSRIAQNSSVCNTSMTNNLVSTSPTSNIGAPNLTDQEEFQEFGDFVIHISKQQE
ncbi:hypothetical protein JTB14_012597 [Gonioctena quinquepunctata]|nr:hypothetical protein JTB14_012597 [Gonioctena quinquepunctata]